MNTRLLQATTVCALLACALPTPAAPMGFKDSTMLMGDLSGNWQELQSNFAFTPRDAIGASFTRMRPEQGRDTEQLVQLEYTRRLMRWNLPDAQANLWLVAGAGQWQGSRAAGMPDPGAADSRATRTMLSPGVQADYETTRVYASLASRLYRAGSTQRDVVSARLGASFYEADYEETQPWAVVELRRMHGISSRIEVTPMLRLVNRRFFVELGMSQSAQLRANFMYTF